MGKIEGIVHRLYGGQTTPRESAHYALVAFAGAGVLETLAFATDFGFGRGELTVVAFLFFAGIALSLGRAVAEFGQEWKLVSAVGFCMFGMVVVLSGVYTGGYFSTAVLGVFGAGYFGKAVWLLSADFPKED